MSELTREQLKATVQCLVNCYPDGCRYEQQRDNWIERVMAHDAALRARLAACEKERDEWKRLYAHRGEALKRACLQCGYTQKEIKPHD